MFDCVKKTKNDRDWNRACFQHDLSLEGFYKNHDFLMKIVYVVLIIDDAPFFTKKRPAEQIFFAFG